MEKFLLLAAVLVAVFIGLALPGPKTDTRPPAASQFATLDVG